MRLSSFLPITLALALAAVGSVVAAIGAVDQLEERARTEVTLALGGQGHDWADVAVDGMLVTLTGTAADEAARFAAVSTAGRVIDATRVIDAMEVRQAEAIAAPDFSIEILRNTDGVSLFGLIPAETDREAFLRRLPGPVSDLLEEADFPAPAGWAQSVDFAVRALRDLPRAKISIRPAAITIAATAENRVTRAEIETRLRASVPAGIALDLRISAPRPVIAPYTLRFSLEEGRGRFEACAADTEAARTAILAAAREAGFAGEAGTCVIALGVPSSDWAQAAGSALRGLAAIGGGTLTMSDTDITIVALPVQQPSIFEREMQNLERQLPQAFTLYTLLPEPAIVDGTGDERPGPPEFVATRSPEGLVQLRGRISDPVTRLAVESFAHARFGVDNIHDATRVDAALPQGWPMRVLSGLEALSHLNNGVVVVQPDYLELRGVTGNPDAAAEIARLLSDKLGDGADYDLQISYLEALDPVAALPTPEECVSRITEIATAQKITFAPGSTTIDTEALDTIDKVADVLRDCEGVRIEIGGHTDSQGRETMNQRLSQARADAVLNAIMARRVLTGNLTAKGYGETTPIADNDSEDGREANRRIEFKLAATATPESGLDDLAEETDE